MEDLQSKAVLNDNVQSNMKSFAFVDNEPLVTCSRWLILVFDLALQAGMHFIQISCTYRTTARRWRRKEFVHDHVILNSCNI